MIEKGSLRLEGPQLFIIVFPVIVFIVGTALIERFAYPDAFSAHAFQSATPELALAGRYLFYAAALLFAFIAVAVTALFAQDLACFDDVSRRRIAAAGGIIVLIYVLAIFLLPSGHTFALLGEKFFLEAMQVASIDIFEHNSEMYFIYRAILFVTNIEFFLLDFDFRGSDAG